MVMELVAAEGFLDLPGTGGSDALIDRQCLPQVRGGLAAAAVVEVAVADALQGTCFLQGHAEITGDGERFGVLVAGPAAYLHRARYRNSGNWSGLLLHDGFSAWVRGVPECAPCPRIGAGFCEQTAGSRSAQRPA